MEELNPCTVCTFYYWILSSLEFNEFICRILVIHHKHRKTELSRCDFI